jgi:hypothetical protein
MKFAVGLMKFVVGLVCVSALALCFTFGVAAQDERAAASTPLKPSQIFQHAAAIKSKAMPEPEAFEFELNGFSYHISSNGNGRRMKDDKKRRFNLWLDGRDFITSIYFSEYEGDLLLICEVSDVESGAGFVTRLGQPSMRARWKQHVPGFNVGEPLREGRNLYVTGIGFVGKLDLETGEYVWKHENLYGRGRKDAFNSFAVPELKGEEVLFKEPSVYNGGGLTIFVNRKSGKLIRIE